MMKGDLGRHLYYRNKEKIMQASMDQNIIEVTCLKKMELIDYFMCLIILREIQSTK